MGHGCPRCARSECDRATNFEIREAGGGGGFHAGITATRMPFGELAAYFLGWTYGQILDFSFGAFESTSRVNFR